MKRQPSLTGADPLAGPAVTAAAILLMPLVGIALVGLGLQLAGDWAERLATGFAVWGGLTSILCAFRLLSARDGKIWVAQLYSSALALVWVGRVHGVPLLLPALGLALSLQPLTVLLSYLTRRFGIARSARSTRAWRHPPARRSRGSSTRTPAAGSRPSFASTCAPSGWAALGETGITSPEELAAATLEGLTPFFNKHIGVVFTSDIQVTRLAKFRGPTAKEG